MQWPLTFIERGELLVGAAALVVVAALEGGHRSITASPVNDAIESGIALAKRILILRV